jgi:hypothetical protein
MSIISKFEIEARFVFHLQASQWFLMALSNETRSEKVDAAALCRTTCLTVNAPFYLNPWQLQKSCPKEPC